MKRAATARGSRKRRFQVALASLALLLGGLAAGCRSDMQDQPKYIPLRGSDFFGDRRSARPLVEGTVARGQLWEDDRLHRGLEGGQPAQSFPFPVTREVLQRGRERYDIFCSPCHDQAGYGDGMIVRRGFRRPPSFHIERLRQAPPGYVFGVITNGFGAMFSYASRIPAEDRWAIIAYVRALQLSQNARIDDVPEAEREKLQRNTQ